MDPQSEMAIKVCGYVELFWDGRPPQWEQIGRPERIRFGDLLPRTFGHSEDLQAAVDGYLQASGEADSSLRKPRLRRAAKVVGLWMKDQKSDADMDAPDRYVVIRQGDYNYYPASREYAGDSQPDGSEKMLRTLREACSRHLAQDLAALNRILGQEVLFDMRAQIRLAAPLSVESVRGALACTFYGTPELMRQVVVALEYVPCFVMEVAAQVQSGPSTEGKKASVFETAVALLERDDLAAKADQLRVPVPFGVAFREELEEIERSRSNRPGSNDNDPSLPNVDKEGKDKFQRCHESNPHKRAFDLNLFGLALSGGGVRSATFSLGVLQRLAELRLLSKLDYLSTVSGGGYIGSWLTGWIQRASLPVVENNIQTNVDPLSDEARPVRFLREYCDYLSPQAGLFTADAWTMISIFLRNLVLNQVIILLVLGASLTAPLLLIGPIALSRQQPGAAIACLVIGATLALLACANMGAALNEQGTNSPWRENSVLLRIVAPCFLSGVLANIGLWGLGFVWPGPSRSSWWLLLIPLFVGCGLAFPHFSRGWYIPYKQAEFPMDSDQKPSWNIKRRHAALLVISASTGALFFVLPMKCLERWSANTFRGDWLVLVAGPSLMLIAYALAVTFYIGIVGRRMSDGRREWWGRLGAWLGLVSLAWLVVSATSVFGPEWLHRIGASGKITIASVWALVSGMGTKLASGPATGQESATTWQGRAKEAIIGLAPYVFIGGLLLFLSLGVQLTCNFVGASWSAHRLLPVSSAFGYEHIFSHYWETMNMTPGVPILVFCLLAGTGLLLSTRVDVNEFSMHHFYRNRLVRAYLGASRERKIRRPNPFTGFDERDDISLSLLKTQNGYVGHLPILNAAMNTTKGQDLATQERKSESFTFTPFRTGFDWFHPQQQPSRRAASQYGYQQTDWRAFGRYSGIRMGTASAISGAAVSPNMGYHSKPAVAFLLSLFNVRLGYWVRNPAVQHATERTSPRLGLLCMLRELGAYTDADSKYVNLSDGGHFENMGLYELVRRRCRYIIVCDAEEDGKFGFDGIGGAIRKCRTDFGAEIELDPRQVASEAGKSSKSHCAVGTITYQEDPSAKGYILYIKATLTGDEPTDVLQYWKGHADFPHQTTANQFFTESQFESYRSLGYHEMSTAMEHVGDIPTGPGWKEKLFRKLQDVWKTGAAVPEHFDSGLWTAVSPEQKIALIYRAYKELGLGTRKGRDAHVGVIRLFKVWKAASAKKRAWPPCNPTFEREFQEFYEDL